MTEEIPSPGALSAHIQRQREAAVPRIEVEHLSVALGGQDVLRDVSVALHDASVLAVLGPSGSGKSTLLRAIAGLVPAAQGAVRIVGRDVTSVPAHRRGVGFVFQDHALFPHRDVAGNVEFGLRMAGVERSARRERVAAVLELVGLGGFERRDVLSLSGGERQRVALARALAPEPGVLLLDEPFAALDRTLRDRLVDELGSLLAHAAVPTVLVTHDHDEAFALGRHVAVLHEGSLVQHGTPEALWHGPATAWVAGFLGFGPTAEGHIVGAEVVDTPWGRLSVATPATVGRDVVVVLRPDALRLDPAGRHNARVERVSLGGAGFEAHLRMGHGPAVRVAAPGSLVVGATVTVRVDPRAVLVYPAEA